MCKKVLCLNTRRIFLLCDNKRPLVAYTEVLNNLTEEEWNSLKLPPPTSAVPRPNMQLPDLDETPLVHVS